MIDLDQGKFSDYNNIFERNMYNINEVLFYSLFNLSEDEIVYFYDFGLDELYRHSMHYDYSKFKELLLELKKIKLNCKNDMILKKKLHLKIDVNTYYKYF